MQCLANLGHRLRRLAVLGEPVVAVRRQRQRVEELALCGDALERAQGPQRALGWRREVALDLLSRDEAVDLLLRTGGVDGSDEAGVAARLREAADEDDEGDEHHEAAQQCDHGGPTNDSARIDGDAEMEKKAR